MCFFGALLYGSGFRSTIRDSSRVPLRVLGLSVGEVISVVIEDSGFMDSEGVGDNASLNRPY